MKEVADLIAEVIKNPGDEGVKTRARKRVADLTARFPVYP